MAIQAFRFTVATTVLLLATMFTSTAAYAQCGCMSGGGDAPKVASGSASTTPNAINLVRDPTWQAHESTWQGVRYMQIYNTTNGVRVAALQIDATGWVIQTDSQSPVTGRTIYRDNEVEVIHYRQSNQDRWIVRPAE
ncbi:MAG: hypothetical protein ACOY82_08810 [Pseudomonadota bacterium]